MASVTLIPIDPRWTTLRRNERRAWTREIGARHTTIGVVLQLSLATAALSGGTVGDIDSSTVDLTWSAAIASLSSTYTLGMTVTINGTPATILSAVLLSGSQTVRVTLSSAVGPADVVAASYDSGPGDLVDGSGLAVASSSASPTNLVGSHYYFDEVADAVHLVTSL